MSATPIDALRERIAELEEANRQLEDALCPPSIAIPLEWGLAPSEARIFAHLASRDMATRQSIMTALFSDRAGDAPEIKIVDVFVCKLRRKLAPFGVRIGTIWGQGYRLEKPDASLP